MGPQLRGILPLTPLLAVSSQTIFSLVRISPARLEAQRKLAKKHKEICWLIFTGNSRSTGCRYSWIQGLKFCLLDSVSLHLILLGFCSLSEKRLPCLIVGWQPSCPLCVSSQLHNQKKPLPSSSKYSYFRERP